MNYATLQKLFTYDKHTGEFRWRTPKGRQSSEPLTSKTVVIDGTSYIKSRLIYQWVTGKTPPEVIDHINGDRTDNRWDNLRAATHRQNQYNRVGYGNYPKGVAFDKGRKKPWLARIRTPSGRKNLGRFSSMEEAAQAYQQAAEKYQGEFALHNSLEKR